MKSVWKFPLAMGFTEVDMPVNSVPLRIAYQGDQLCLWALCPTDAAYHKEKHSYQVFGTGHPVPPIAKYIGSASKDGFEWHVFRV